jgi:hypothetical protein
MRQLDSKYLCIPDRELTEPQDAESMPELRRLLHSSADVDISELMADFHIEQGE